MLPPNSSKNMSEHRRKRRNIRSNEANKKLRTLTSRIDEENRELVSLSVVGPHEEQGQNQELRYLLPQKNPTVYLTATSNHKHCSVDKDCNEEYYLPIWNPSTTDDEENEKTEDPIDPAKPTPSAVSQIDTAQPSPIAEVYIVATKASVVLSTRVPDSLSSNSVSSKP